MRNAHGAPKLANPFIYLTKLLAMAIWVFSSSSLMSLVAISSISRMSNSTGLGMAKTIDAIGDFERN